MSAKLRRWLLMLALSILLVPIAVFLGGQLLAGPYAGEGGIFGMMWNIYRDALSGHLSAWILLLAPVLLFLIWVSAFWLHSNIRIRQGTASET